jgi:hypothetical protein
MNACSDPNNYELDMSKSLVGMEQMVRVQGLFAPALGLVSPPN